MLGVASEAPPVSEVGAREGCSRASRGDPCRVTEPVSPLRPHGRASCRCRRTLGRPRPGTARCPEGNTAARIPGPRRARGSGRAAGRREGKARLSSAAPLLQHGGAVTGWGHGARGCPGEAVPRERLWLVPVARGDGGHWLTASRGAAPSSVSLPSRRGRVPPRRAHRVALPVSRKRPNRLAARVPPPSLPAGGPLCPQAQTGSSRAHVPLVVGALGVLAAPLAFQGAESRSGACTAPPWGRPPRAAPEVGCSLHHPQPRGDLRMAAHTDQLLTVRRAGATRDPCPGGRSPRSRSLGLAKQGWGWLLAVAQHVVALSLPGSLQQGQRAPGTARGARKCRKSLGQTRHPRWLSGCVLSGSDRVIPKLSLSKGRILPSCCPSSQGCMGGWWHRAGAACCGPMRAATSPQPARAPQTDGSSPGSELPSLGT